MGSLIYDQLVAETGKEEIRLLRIPLGTPGDPIECELNTVSLSSNPEYSALSYVWGAPHPTKAITCNGLSFEVGLNLFSALDRLRDKTRHYGEEYLVLWVDAICINQRNTSERESQVQIMRQIYENAEKTFIWMGEEEEDTWKVFVLLRTLNEVKEAQQANGDKRLFFEMGIEGQKSYELPHMLDPTYSALSTFLRRTWFTRVWIIQELAVSKRPIIWCGSWEVSWDSFFDAIEHASKLILPIWDNATGLQRVFELGGIRLSIIKGETQSLLTLLLISRPFNSTDPKDKIYALLGLANDAGKEALDVEPNYSILTRDLYQNVAFRILQREAGANILSVPRVPGLCGIAGLPSWVPDWTVSNDCMSLQFPSMNYNFHASLENIKFEITRADEHSETIKLSGFVVATIEKIGDVHTLQGPNGLTFLQKLQQIPNEQAVFTTWEQICYPKSGKKYPFTDEDIQDAYWQTLLAGRLSGGYDAAKKGYLQWDQIARSHFRKLPNFKSFKWLNSAIAIPSMIKMGLDMAKTATSLAPQPSMAFRSDLTVAGRRRFFKTDRGHIGLGPALAEKGDSIVLVKGVKVPLVLRSNGGKGCWALVGDWELIGDCYVHGIMKGEEFDLGKCVDIWIGAKP